ncbi:FtsX-like permease family protein [Corynebacterium sp. H127]|uniref:FtsX-like permease family protein n=1 Tax=Corynebacterium sp. H127 TaxID=3133418 RepID=UPI00309AE4A6
MILKLAWRDIYLNWKRSILAIILFSIPVFAIAFITSFGVFDISSRPLQGPTYSASVATTACEDPSDTACLSDLTRNEVPDLQRVEEATGQRGIFYPIYDVPVSIEFGSEQLLTRTNLVFNELGATPPIQPGHILLDENTAQTLGKNVGDTVQISVPEDSAPREFTVQEITKASFYVSNPALNVADIPGLPAPAEIKSASLPDEWYLRWGSDTELAIASHAPDVYVASSKPLSEQPPRGVTLLDEVFQESISASEVAAAIAMAALAVIFLAAVTGPVFAVAARRNLRINAMLSANGATNQQLFGIMLIQGSLIGGLGAALGLAATFLVGLASRIFSGGEFGILFYWDLLLLLVVAAMLCGLCSALVPALLAIRMDPVQALSEGASVRMRSLRWWHFLAPAFFLGFVLLTRHDGDGFFFGIVGCVATAILSGPLMLLLVARTTRLTMPLRLAARDAVRSYMRTVPAIGAIIGCLLLTGMGVLGSTTATELAQPSAVARIHGGMITGPAPIENHLQEIQQDLQAPLRTDFYELHNYIKPLSVDDPRFDPESSFQLETGPINTVVHSSYYHDLIVATPNVIDAIALQLPGTLTTAQVEDLKKQLSEGKAIVSRPDLAATGSVRIKYDEEVVAEFPAIPLDNSDNTAPYALITPETARSHGLETIYANTQFDGGHQSLLRELLFDYQPLQLTSSGSPIDPFVVLALSGLAFLLVFAITLLLVLLSGMESAQERATLRALGAEHCVIRRYSAAQGLVITLAGVIGATVSGMLMFAITWHEISWQMLQDSLLPLAFLVVGVLAVSWLTGYLVSSVSGAQVARDR